MYIGSQHPFSYNTNGGTLDYSNGGFRYTAYFGCPSNYTSFWQCYCRLDISSDESWMLCDLVPIATKVGAEFLGWYNYYGGTEFRIFDENGETVLGTGNLKACGVEYCYKVYAKWRQYVWQVNLNTNGGSGGTSSVFFNTDNTAYYAENTCQTGLSSITIPTRTRYKFLGYYSAASGGTQYVDASGAFTNAAYSIAPTDTVTFYAHWELASYAVYINDAEGTGGSSVVYSKTGTGGIYADMMCTTVKTTVNVPTLTNFRFLGYYSAASGGTQYVNASGTILSALTSAVPTEDITIYAHWERSSYNVNLDKGTGGTGGTSQLYSKVTTGGIYADSACTQAMQALSIPERSGYAFLGYFDSASGTTQYVGEYGAILPALQQMILSADLTIYAQWRIVYVGTFDKHGGTGGADGIWYDPDRQLFYDDPMCQYPVQSVLPPTRMGWVFNGYFSAASGGTKYINADGTFASGFSSMSGDMTLHAQWTRTAYIVSFDERGGSCCTPRIFYKLAGGGFYADEAFTTPVTAITPSARAGYTATGFYTAISGGTQVVNASGTLLVASVADDTTYYAQWTARSFTLYFDYVGAAPSVQEKTVTMGQAVGELPTATLVGYTLLGWFVDGNEITATSLWNVPNNATAYAYWRRVRTSNFGTVADYFNLASPSLRPIASSSGDNKQRICVSHVGPIEHDVSDIGGIWRNPQVTYEVVRDCNLNVVLGTAFAGTGANISGYMITSVEVRTQYGKFPLVTVRAVANEGANAINLFSVSIDIKGRAHAQNLLNATSCQGNLTSCNLTASCDPVVVEEHLMPCASDVVNGKMTAGASYYLPNGNGVPTAGGGFTLIGQPKQTGGTEYPVWNITVEKEI